MSQTLKNNRINVLDGWRVIMLLIISWYHIWQQSWLPPAITVGAYQLSIEPYIRTGYMMVDAIILLSSFVLFLPYAAYLTEGGTLPEIKDFYVRRAARIIPSYYLYLVTMIFILPFGTYENTARMWIDLLRHAAFIHVFFKESYMFSPIGMIVWTLGIEVQAYLIFPLIARLTVKKPLPVWLCLLVSGILYRILVMRRMSDYSLFMNQLPAFLDVYALGMCFSYLYTRIKRRLKENVLTQTVFSVLALAAFLILLMILRDQSREIDYTNIHIGQMTRRLPLTLCFGGLFVFSAFGIKPLRTLLGNRYMHFCAGITFNYYLWHPVICQLLRRWRFPPYTDNMPQRAGEVLWQVRYSYLCFLISVTVAVIITYIVEKPIGRHILNHTISKRRVII